MAASAAAAGSAIQSSIQCLGQQRDLILLTILHIVINDPTGSSIGIHRTHDQVRSLHHHRYEQQQQKEAGKWLHDDAGCEADLVLVPRTARLLITSLITILMS